MADYTGSEVSERILEEPLDLPFDNSEYDPSAIAKEAVAEVEGLFLLRDVFSREECQAIIERVFAERSPAAHPVMWRKWADDPEEEEKHLGVRTIYKAPDVAALFWERVEPFVPDEMETTAKKTGEVMVWRKLGLSERLKFVKYDATQNFPSHYDGAYVKSERLRSQISVLFYLDKSGGFFSMNKDFRGGELRFLERGDSPGENKKLYDLVPDTGLCVMFPHRRLHEAMACSAGHKYVIRTDVMFELVSVDGVPVGDDVDDDEPGDDTNGNGNGDGGASSAAPETTTDDDSDDGLVENNLH